MKCIKIIVQKQLNFKNCFYRQRCKEMKEAIRLYEAAAEELALIIGAVYRKLEFSGDTIVSYSGGLFHAGDFILKPLVRKLEENGICLCPPKYSPVQGAALLAAREYSRDGEFLSRIKAGLE